MYLDREQVIHKAYDECMVELYKKAQPSADFHEYVRKIKAKEITKDDQVENPIYTRHYLSEEETQYIIKKYCDAYRLNNEFDDACDLLINDAQHPYMIDKFVESYTDDNGDFHPGCRDYEEIPPISKQINNELKKYFGEDINNDVSTAIEQIFINFINSRKNFYHFDCEAERFKASLVLGPSPTSNKEMVMEYWEKQGQPIEIIDRDPDRLWLYDQGYTDEEIDKENDEYN